MTYRNCSYCNKVFYFINPNNKTCSDNCRFWQHVDIKSDDQCWNWLRSIDCGGYGSFGFNKRIYHAHRVAYILTHKKILTKDIHICHTCDNRKCVNPNHLWEGNHLSNNRDKAKKGRSTKGRNWKISKLGSNQGVKNASAKLTEQQVLDIRKSKDTTLNLSELYKISETTILNIKNNKTWRHLELTAPDIIESLKYKGSKIKNAKLNEEKVKIIKSSNKSAKELGKEFGVSEFLIYQVRAGKIWKHV